MEMYLVATAKLKINMPKHKLCDMQLQVRCYWQTENLS